MKARYLSLLGDPPPGYATGPIGKRELLSGVVVVLADDCASAYALLPDFRSRVAGVVVTFGAALVTRVGPLLWHARLPRGELVAGSGLLALTLEAVAVASGERDAAQVARLTEEQLRINHAIHVKDYLRVTHSLREQVELLAASESKLSTILDSVDACIYLKDRQGAYLFANRRWRDLRRVGMKQLVGATDDRFYDAPTAAMTRINERRVLDDGATIRAEESRADPATGLAQTWLTTKLPLRREDGSIYALCAISTDITSRKQVEDEIRQLAFFDPLTQLPNRRLLLDRIEQALAASLRHHHPGALLYIDLDHFKDLNDTLGHDCGDQLLREVARRLVACVREEDTVARLGGDEFVVMLSGLDDTPQEAADQAKMVGEKILASFARPFELAGNPYRCTASVGIALFSDHPANVEDLLKRGDLSMYQAKAGGRNTLRFFDADAQATINARDVPDGDLAAAIAEDQLLLYFQAQMGGDRRLRGAEVLVRWQHPRRGLLLPGEFIAQAEATGQIVALGRWVLDASCAQLARWAQQDELAALTIAVNVSARQFQQRDFAAQVLAALDGRGADPCRLQLEISESLLAGEIDDVIAKMKVLKARGVRFSLDDLGTGDTTLACLKRLPLDQLKIDRVFVRDLLLDANDAVIAKMIVALADSLGLEVIAEGVESQAQFDFLVAHGCHSCQGNLISRPLPLAVFEQFARGQPGGA